MSTRYTLYVKLGFSMLAFVDFKVDDLYLLNLNRERFSEKVYLLIGKEKTVLA